MNPPVSFALWLDQGRLPHLLGDPLAYHPLSFRVLHALANAARHCPRPLELALPQERHVIAGRCQRTRCRNKDHLSYFCGTVDALQMLTDTAHA